MPAMLGEIVVQLLGEQLEIEVVGRSAPKDDALRAAHQGSADLLIVREDADGAVGSILAQPGLGILSIASDGHGGALVRLAQQPVTLDRSSLGTLASIIGGAVAGHA